MAELKAEPKRNIVVRADKRGRFLIYVGGQYMGGVTKVIHTTDWAEPAGRLLIEVTGFAIDFSPIDLPPADADPEAAG